MAEVTRGEFDMLSQQVADNARRLEVLDNAGTRGVGVLQIQLTDLAKDFAAHEAKHSQLEDQRRAARRWAWGFAAAGAASVAAMLSLLADIASHLH